MGDPKKQKKSYEKPFRPWDRKRIEKEGELIKKYGLKRKKEIYKVESILRNFRRQARTLAASENKEGEEKLLEKLEGLGLVGKNSNLEDILSLEIEDILKRRLQTVLFEKELAKTPKQARQLIVHGHVLVGDRKIKWPSFLVPKKFENKIKVKIGVENE